MVVRCFIHCYAECHYAECCYAKCRGAFTNLAADKHSSLFCHNVRDAEKKFDTTWTHGASTIKRFTAVISDFHDKLECLSLQASLA